MWNIACDGLLSENGFKCQAGFDRIMTKLPPKKVHQLTGL